MIRAMMVLVVMGGALACGGRQPLPEEGAATRTVASRSEPRNAEELIHAMQRRYADRWYRTLSFKQTVERWGPDGSEVPVAVWEEWARVPGMLRIDLDTTDSGNGVIYRGDSLYVFRGGELAQATATRNELLILGFDVYGQAPARTLEVLREEGFDLSKFRSGEWQGRPVWIVGADAGDERTKQFWVDQERLLFVRLLQPLEQNPNATMEIRFDDYEPLGGGWIAPTVVFNLDGRMVMREVYFDMVADPVLPEGIFDPEAYGPVR